MMDEKLAELAELAEPKNLENSAVSVAYSPSPSPHDEAFLRLPKLLYTQSTIHQNYQEEMAILAETHPLSHYFTAIRFVVYSNGTPIARALLTLYTSGDAYVGYYECQDDARASEALFAELFAEAERRGVTKIIGPYNASFWLQYRLKLNLFNEPMYMGEPANKPYYADHFRAAGFIKTYHYVSNEYKRSYDKATVKVFDAASERAKKLNYRIVSPKPADFIHTMGHTYDMFSRLYSDFPGFQPITKAEYVASLQAMEPLVHTSFVKFAYYNNEVVGFIVAFPDYGNLPYRRMTWWNKLRIAARKIRASRYVILYVGVVPEHSGLSKALIRSVVIAAVLRGASILGALALESKVTANMAQHNIKKQFEYGLFEKEL